MRKPCINCPFRKDALKGWLGEKRSTEIAEGVINGNGLFYCHKTLDYTQDTEGEITDKTRVCAGSVILHKNEGRANAYYRMIDHNFIGHSSVFTSIKAFIERHSDNGNLQNDQS